METGDRKHASEADVLKFLERKDQSSDYVRRTAEWIKEQFPGSAPAMLPKMRAIYRDKKQAGI